MQLSPLYANLIMQEIPTRYGAQHFYANISGQHLTEKYHEASDRIVLTINQSDKVEKQQIHSSEHRFGSRLVPMQQNLKEYFEGLTRHFTSDLLQLGATADTWNHMVIYCFRLLQLSTGIRPVRDGFPDWSDINFKLGWVRISDKDNRFFYEMRMIPMATQLKKWLGFLASYQRTCFLSMDFHLVGISAPYRSQPTQDIFVYFDTEKKEVRPLNQAMIERVESGNPNTFFHYKPNALRHNLLTCLLENGTDQHIIDFIMGHKHFGQEPFGRYSPISSKQYAEKAIQAIDEYVVAPLNIESPPDMK